MTKLKNYNFFLDKKTTKNKFEVIYSNNKN